MTIFRRTFSIFRRELASPLLNPALSTLPSTSVFKIPGHQSFIPRAQPCQTRRFTFWVSSKPGFISEASMFAVDSFLKETHGVNFSLEANNFFVNEANVATLLLDRFADPQSNLNGHKINLNQEQLDKFYKSIKHNAENSRVDRIGAMVVYDAVNTFFDTLEGKSKSSLTQGEFDDLWETACCKIMSNADNNDPSYLPFQ